MKHAIMLVAAAGVASALALPAQAQTSGDSDGLRAQVIQHTDISAQRRYYHRRYYGYRPHYWGPRYGYYRPYRYYGPYAYAPGVGFGFYGGPRFGVWF